LGLRRHDAFDGDEQAHLDWLAEQRADEDTVERQEHRLQHVETFREIWERLMDTLQRRKERLQMLGQGRVVAGKPKPARVRVAEMRARQRNSSGGTTP